MCNKLKEMLLVFINKVTGELSLLMCMCVHCLRGSPLPNTAAEKFKNCWICSPSVPE